MSLKTKRYLKFLCASILLVPLLLALRRSGVLCPSTDFAEFQHSSVPAGEIPSTPPKYKSVIPTSTSRPFTRKAATKIGGELSNSAGLQQLVKVLQLTTQARLHQYNNNVQLKKVDVWQESKILQSNKIGFVEKQSGKFSQPLADDELQGLEENEREEVLISEIQKNGVQSLSQKGDRDYSNFVIQNFIIPRMSKRHVYEANRPVQKLQSQKRRSMRLVTKSSSVDSRLSDVKIKKEFHWNQGNVQQITKNTGIALGQALNCSTLPCLNYLTLEDLVNYDSCHKKELSAPLDHSRPWVTNCHFRRDYATKKYRHVALMSSPGAAIDQFRRILEIASGICTGSVKCDGDLRRTGMVGEGVTSTAVLVVKNDAQYEDWVHTSGSSGVGKGSAVYDLVVFLYRNPYQSIMEEWIKMDSSSVKNNTKEWMEFVANQTEAWEKSIKNGVLQKTQTPVHLVKYENLQKDVESQLRDIFTFLELPPAPSIPGGLTWGSKQDRRRRAEEYSSQQREWINSAILRMAKELSGKHRYADSVEIISYVSTGLIN